MGGLEMGNRILGRLDRVMIEVVGQLFDVVPAQGTGIGVEVQVTVEVIVTCLGQIPA